MNQEDERKKPEKQPENQRSVSDEQVEKLLSQAEKELLAIETDEIITGYSPEELEDKGLLGEKNIFIPRSAFAEEERKCGFEFSKNVEWLVKEGYKDISEVSLEEVAHISDVVPGRLIAIKKQPGTSGHSETPVSPPDLNKDYLSTSNVIVKTEPGKICFFSNILGKVVLFNRQIYVVKSTRDGTFALRVASDNMSACVDLFPAKGMGKQVELKDMENMLKEKGIIAGLKLDTLAKSLEDIKKSVSPILDILVAEGKKPIDGIAAKPEFFFTTEQAFEDFRVLPDGRVDYRKKTTIQIIHKGDILARIGEPQKGENGFDVFGTVLPCKEGAVDVLCPGENVGISKDLKEFTAEIDGMLSFNGNVLSVFPNYIVEGDVDFSTGNIDFGGNIIINGSVLPGFEVKATGDITVRGTIDSAIVIAGRDVRVFGGIIGGPDSIVNCGRDLHVHHLQNAAVEVQGDVHVNSSSIQSTIYSNGKVFAKIEKGSIVGGLVNALKGVEAQTLGNQHGTKTRIFAGDDFLIQKTIAEIEKVIAFCESNIFKIETVLRPLLTAFRKGADLKKEQKIKINPILDKRKKLKKRLAIMRMKHHELEHHVSVDIKPVIKVRGTIYPDVTVKINNEIKQIEKTYQNVTIYYCSQQKCIVVGPYLDTDPRQLPVKPVEQLEHNF